MPLVFANLSDAIFHFAKLKPGAPAIHEHNSTISQGEFASLVGKAAVYLNELGVKPGEFVGVLLPTNAEHVILLFAALRVGAVPVDLSLRQGGHADLFRRFGVKRVFAMTGMTVPEASVHPIDPDWREVLAGKIGDHRCAASPEQLSIFRITSGSTGLPKGVLTTQRQWNERYRTDVELFPDLINADRPPNLLVIGELSFANSFRYLANQISIGGPIVPIGVLGSATELAKAIDSWEDAVFFTTPQTCRDLVANCSTSGPRFCNVRALVVSGAPLFAHEKQEIAKRLTPNLYERYGNAVTGLISALMPADIERKPESVGRVAPGIAVDIVDRAGMPVAPGVLGHIRCRGSGIAERFHGPGAASSAGPEGFREGSYYPGDIGTMDAEGYLYVKGRVSELINRRGIEIYAPEIEAVLSIHPNVLEAAVFGVPGTPGNDRVMAVIVPRGAADLEALAQHCRTHLPPEKFPNQLFWADAIPKTGPGKFDKPALTASILKRETSPAART
jgi:long-chain acyl-CoA synthetase